MEMFSGVIQTWSRFPVKGLTHRYMQSSVLFQNMSTLHWAPTQMWPRNPQSCPSRWCVWLGVDYYFSQWEKKREDRKDETNIIPNSCSGIWVMIQGIFKRFRKVLPKTLLPISWCSNMEPGLVDQLDLSDTRAHCLKLHPHIPAKDRGTGHAKVDW